MFTYFTFQTVRLCIHTTRLRSGSDGPPQELFLFMVYGRNGSCISASVKADYILWNRRMSLWETLADGLSSWLRTLRPFSPFKSASTSIHNDQRSAGLGHSRLYTSLRHRRQSSLHKLNKTQTPRTGLRHPSFNHCRI